MLQQNNNNNCLDMTHRDLLHECRRTNVSFTGALEFGAIPLIKGLRAWAVSGGYSKARRKANIGTRAQGICQQPHENRVGLRSWPGPVSSGYRHTLDSTSNATRTPGVRQGGLGALVTVATLKGTEAGGRQTQTRCLFLKPQGRGSYICAVGNRGANPRTHAVILEGTKEEHRCSSKAPRVTQEGTDEGGLFKTKPRAIRKWRKCSKTTTSVEKRMGSGEPVRAINQCQEGTGACEAENSSAKLEPGRSVDQSDNGSRNDEESSIDAQDLSNLALESTLDLKSTTNCKTEPSVDHPPSEVPVSIQKNQESSPHECLLDCENLFEETGDLITDKDGTPDTKSTVVPEGRGSPLGVECSTTEKKKRPPVCQHWEELITERGELEVQRSDKSPSRGFTAPTANITVTAIHSQPNPAPTTTAAIATAIPELSKGEVGARGGETLLLVNSELLSELARVDKGDKVATDEGSLDVEEEEEDEFGAFMHAGGEQMWTNELQHCERTSSADANETVSWASDWTEVQSSQQSESTWVAFSQKTVEQKIVPGEQWWPSTEKPKLPLSPFHNLSDVFLEAFPSEKSCCEDPAYIPTLKQFLQGSAEIRNTGEEHKEQSLLDGLQDLDRMIGVKYKRAESLSCKLLLRSLHLERPRSECATVRLKSGARFSPNLPSSNQQLAANAKRRLSYDFNRNIMT